MRTPPCGGVERVKHKKGCAMPIQSSIARPIRQAVIRKCNPPADEIPRVHHQSTARRRSLQQIQKNGGGREKKGRGRADGGRLGQTARQRGSTRPASRQRTKHLAVSYSRAGGKGAIHDQRMIHHPEERPTRRLKRTSLRHRPRNYVPNVCSSFACGICMHYPTPKGWCQSQQFGRRCGASKYC